MARNPSRLIGKVYPQTEVIYGDVFDRDSLNTCLTGVQTAFYMIHSMGSKDDFETRDQEAAENFARAAAAQNVGRIIYLGGLGNQSEELSKHLKSRQQVGTILGKSGIPVLELRASIVIGSGSLSFEMIRALVERLPVMITPKWVSVLAQPIAIEDLLDYLVRALDLSFEGHLVLEIGGADQVSYGEIMQEYAYQRGLRRYMIKVPFLTPYLSSLWLGLVTPIYARVGQKLIKSILHPTVVQSQLAQQYFDLRPRSMPEAISRAIANEDDAFSKTRWSDAVSSSGGEKSWAGVKLGSRFIETRSALVNCTASQAFKPIQRIGGDAGWYYANYLWKLRGFVDLLVGGAGLRRGRKHPEEIVVGDTIDFWRVEAYEQNKGLRLVAEMKLPGRAWLEFSISSEDKSTRIEQTAIFDPHGVAGRAYWYSLYPLHKLIFSRMMNKIVESIEGNRADTRHKR
jgi:uncharacterized protein YbjT (DUF2867 family)